MSTILLAADGSTLVRGVVEKLTEHWNAVQQTLTFAGEEEVKYERAGNELRLRMPSGELLPFMRDPIAAATRKGSPGDPMPAKPR